MNEDTNTQGRELTEADQAFLTEFFGGSREVLNPGTCGCQDPAFHEAR